jgi:trigger factor
LTWRNRRLAGISGAFLKRWVKTTKNTAEHKLTDEEIEKQYPAMIEGLKWQLAKEQIAKKNKYKT